MDDLTQICFGTEWISQADDASWCPACLAVPTALHMCWGTTGCENRRPGSPHHSEPLSLPPPSHSFVSKEESGKVNNCLYLQRSSKSAPFEPECNTMTTWLWRHTHLQSDFTLLVIYTLSFVASSNWISLAGLTGTLKAVCSRHSREAWVSPGRQMCCSHLLRSTCHRSGGNQGEVKRCYWITEGTSQCGKGEVRRDKKSGRTRRRRDKQRPRDRKSEGDPTPQSQRMDAKGGINSWIQLLSRSFVTAARGWQSLWRLSTVFFLPLSLLSLHSHPFIETWKQCREVCLTCSRQSGRQTVLMKFRVPRENHISPSSFLSRCGQETPQADLYLSQLLLHIQHSAWLNHSLQWPFTVTLKSWKHCLLCHSAST